MAFQTENIRKFALGVGFDLVGFTPADPLPQHEQALRAWLSAGYAGEMAYMARDPSRRANPKQILPEAKTIICLALNYYPGDHPQIESSDQAWPVRARGVGASEGEWRDEEGAPGYERRRVGDPPQAEVGFLQYRTGSQLWKEMRG